MKKILFTLFITTFIFIGVCFADNYSGLRDYDGVEIPRGSFIPVISTQEISTACFDVGSKVKFISTNDLYLYEINVIPRETEFFGYIEKVNEPVIGTNASMIIKIVKLKLSDGFEIPMRGYIYTPSGNLIGGELTAPAKYEKKASYRQGFRNMVGYVPGPTRKMGEHTVIASGADLMVILVSPLLITHTVTN
ncbi:MAG: hypothetical protein WCY19_06450 [Candidatus Gastranaerophilaceae bacterium]